MTNTPTTNPLVRALSRWENEGGSAQSASPDFDHTAIVQHLGTAVMMRWGTLPRDVQRELFAAAVDLEEPNADSDVVRQHIAVFLHQHKSDERKVDRGGEA